MSLSLFITKFVNYLSLLLFVFQFLNFFNIFIHFPIKYYSLVETTFHFKEIVLKEFLWLSCNNCSWISKLQRFSFPKSN